MRLLLLVITEMVSTFSILVSCLLLIDSISSLGKTNSTCGNSHELKIEQVMGATDPSSGTASVHEVVRGLGHLLRKGWRPLRTILIASWDAEEVKPIVIMSS